MGPTDPRRRVGLPPWRAGRVAGGGEIRRGRGEPDWGEEEEGSRLDENGESGCRAPSGHDSCHVVGAVKRGPQA
jgi:hypothetical protein